MSERHPCTGHCCEKFTLPYPPCLLDILVKYGGRETARDGAPLGRSSAAVPARVRHLRELLDVRKMQGMFRFLGFSATEPATGGEPDAQSQRQPGGALAVYTCNRYDAVTRLCTDYENRPALCSGYPYKERCRYTGCTLEPRDGT